MFERFRNTPLMYWSLELLIVATLIWVCTKINFLFNPIGTFISTVFTPIIIATFLYYMLNPLVILLTKVHYKKFKISRNLAIAIVFILFLSLIVWGVSSFIPNLVKQVMQLISNIPSIAKGLQASFNDLMKNPVLRKIDLEPLLKNVNGEIGKYAESLVTGMTNGIGGLIGTVANVTVIILTVPITLFYMLRDGYKLVPTISRFVKGKNHKDVEELFASLSRTLSSYISGLAIECVFIGLVTMVGYLIIGQQYALLLAVIAGVCNIIPYIGPYFGIFPALLVAISQSPRQVLYVCIVVIIVHQIDGNLVYPNVIGKSLQIHPLTIILLLLVAGKIAGIFGMILAIPTYAVVKVLIHFGVHIWRLNNEVISQKISPKK